jgi:hypothetical protein
MEPEFNVPDQAIQRAIRMKLGEALWTCPGFVEG